MKTTPGRYEYCFIIAYGRSGSTLLQGVLNAVDGYLIRGENGGILNYLHRAAGTALDAKRKHSAIAGDPSLPWYGIDLLDRGRLLADLRSLFIRNFLQPGPSHLCLGCKEIRYGPDSIRSLADLVDFMEETFPGARFIFNSRNLDDVARSGWWKRMKEPAAYLAAFEARMREVHARGRGNSFWVHYDDYAGAPDKLRPLFDFLGEPFDGAKIRAVLERPHGVGID